MKFNKSIKIILLILVLIVLFLIIRSTYSKYISTKDSGTTFHISKWNIVLNNKNISENEDFTQDIQIIYDENTENIAQDVIVPTSKGHFEVTLESTGTELPFEYEFKVADIGVDTKSNYVTSLKQEPWTNDGITYIYPIILNIDYSFLERPIWYYYTNTEAPYDSGQHYDELEIEIVLPENFSCESTYLGNCLKYSIDGNVIKFTPQWYSWNTSSSTDVIYPDPENPTYSSNSYSDNTLSQELHLKYNGKIDLNLENFWDSVSIDGTEVVKNSLPDYKIVAYSLNGGTKTPIPADTGAITGTVEPPKDANGNFTGAEVINNFTIYVEWDDSENNILDNQGDVAISKDNNISGLIPIQLNIKQIQ